VIFDCDRVWGYHLHLASLLVRPPGWWMSTGVKTWLFTTPCQNARLRRPSIETGSSWRRLNLAHTSYHSSRNYSATLWTLVRTSMRLVQQYVVKYDLIVHDWLEYHVPLVWYVHDRSQFHYWCLILTWPVAVPLTISLDMCMTGRQILRQTITNYAKAKPVVYKSYCS
jgi:hypothetical protein